MKSKKVFIDRSNVGIMSNFLEELLQAYFKFLKKSKDYSYSFALKLKNTDVFHISADPVGFTIKIINNINSSEEDYTFCYSYEDYNNGSWKKELIDTFQSI